MGIIAVAFIFGKRGCSWLPQNRVKNIIAANRITLNDSIKDLLVCNSITSAEIYALLDSDGSIDFGESDPHLEYKEYVINGPNDLQVVFALHDDFSEIIAVKSNCTTTVTSHAENTLPLPQSIVSTIIESHVFTYYPTAECQIKCNDLKDEDVRSFHKTAHIDMSKSNAWPKGKIEEVKNKIYYLKGQIKGVDYGIVFEIGENRTRIKFIEGPTECDC